VSLLEQVDDLWKQGAEKRAAGWAEKLRDANKHILSAKQQFHEWYPLKAYLCYTNAINPRIQFSLRYLGQEVATLRVGVNRDLSIHIPRKTAAVNKKLFGIALEDTFDWRDAKAQTFRKHFQRLNHSDYYSLVKEEHHVESEFLRHMKNKTRDKFNGTLQGIQPVMLCGFPFQFPLPISGNSGVPKLNKGKGNIDILARRGTGKGTKISVWELKRPGTTAHAIPQAYIYAATLLKMLRTPQSGGIWYRDIIGFGGKVPDKLTIESVVAVSISSDRERTKFEEKLRTFKRDNLLSVGNDTIKLHIAHYQKDPLTVEMVEF